jgi:hypothetical protein
VTDIDDDYGDDRYDEYKDDLAMGYINEDGSQREPDPTLYLEQQAEEEYWRHCDEAHGGTHCDCPREPIAADSTGPYSDEPPF